MTRLFSGPKYSHALRNTRNRFRELYGELFGPEKFSGVLRNARLVPKGRVSHSWHSYGWYLLCQVVSLDETLSLLRCINGEWQQNVKGNLANGLTSVH